MKKIYIAVTSILLLLFLYKLANNKIYSSAVYNLGFPKEGTELIFCERTDLGDIVFGLEFDNLNSLETFFEVYVSSKPLTLLYNDQDIDALDLLLKEQNIALKNVVYYNSGYKLSLVKINNINKPMVFGRIVNL